MEKHGVSEGTGSSIEVAGGSSQTFGNQRVTSGWSAFRRLERKRERLGLIEARRFDRKFGPFMERFRRLERACLYVIVDPSRVPGRFWRFCSGVLRGGADIIQLRGPGLDAGKLLRYARRLARVIRSESDALFIVNDRPDVALQAEADGVHLGKHDIPLAAARRLLGPNRILGATTHNVREVRSAVKAGADYLSYGPVFASPTKPDLKPRGFGYLKAMKRLGVPFFAIGGINAANVNSLCRKGIRRICVSSFPLSFPDPALALVRLRLHLFGVRNRARKAKP